MTNNIYKLIENNYGKIDNKIIKNINDEDIKKMFDEGNENAIIYLLNKYKKLIQSKFYNVVIFGEGYAEDFLQNLVYNIYRRVYNIKETIKGNNRGRKLSENYDLNFSSMIIFLCHAIHQNMIYDFNESHIKLKDIQKGFKEGNLKSYSNLNYFKNIINEDIELKEFGIDNLAIEKNKKEIFIEIKTILNLLNKAEVLLNKKERKIYLENIIIRCENIYFNSEKEDIKNKNKNKILGLAHQLNFKTQYDYFIYCLENNFVPYDLIKVIKKNKNLLKEYFNY